MDVTCNQARSYPTFERRITRPRGGRAHVPLQNLKDTDTETTLVLQVPAQGKIGILTPTERRAYLREVRQRIESAFLELAGVLRTAFDAEDWRTLNYFSFADYVEDTLKVSKSEAYDLMKLDLIRASYPDLTPRMLDAGKSNMRAVLPKLDDLTDYKSVEAWIDAAAVNSWRNLQSLIRDEPMQASGHFVTCPNCGERFKP